MYEVMVREHFSSAHALRGYQGKCENLHGHNWVVEIFAHSTKLNSIGIALDFSTLKGALRQRLEELDHKDLNELPPFEDINPTSENIAKYLFDTMSRAVNGEGVRIVRVNVWETPNCRASYFEED